MIVGISFKNKRFTTVIDKGGKEYPSSAFELKELFDIIVEQIPPNHLFSALQQYLANLILMKRHELTKNRMEKK